jgi:UDP-N-acetylmuramyl pentapeptide phosphotransferase/UDP-N-acetylglucosamine-1-phosphate transferase
MLDPFAPLHNRMLALAIVAASAALTVALIVWLRPLLLRYALARPNARSSHKAPTPQGGGIAVVAATLMVSAFVLWVLDGPVSPFGRTFGLLFAAASLIALLGALDDIRGLGVGTRLAGQAVAVALVLAALPADASIAPVLPWWIERALLFLAGLWFVNLVNFMDGLDWMTVAETVPVAGGLVLLSALGALPAHGLVIALALFGAVLGFAPFNRPVARLFLGDVGSLPLGLMLGYLLVLVAAAGHVAAALLLPLYYLADATLTLLRRLRAGEKVWQAHRSHFYQRATDNGFTVMQVVARVFALNLALVALAVFSVWQRGLAVQTAALALGCVLVAVLLTSFSRKRA